MIDFHNHVLPGVDDGPQDIEESIKMLKFASDQGITDIIQTVHFQHPKMINKNVDYSYLKSKIQELQNKINDNNMNIKMHLAAEVFYLPNLTEIIDNPLVTIANRKYMLIEFASSIYPNGYEQEFYKLQNLGVTPIVAHPERYLFVKKDIKILETWIDRGYLIQLDAGSILGGFGSKTKDFALDIIKHGYFHMIGSDAHNSRNRNFCINDAYNFLKNNYSKELVENLKNNVNNLIEGKKLNNINFNQIGSNKKNIINIVKQKLLKFIKSL